MNNSILNEFNRLVSPIKKRISNIILRVLVESVDDSTRLQLIKAVGLHEENCMGIERLQEYGFTSNPPDNSEGVLLSVNGDRSSGIIIGVDSSEFRIKNLEKGAICVYDFKQNQMKFTNTSGIEITASEKKVEISSPVQVNVLAPSVRLGSALTIDAALGVVTMACQCAVTGAVHPVGSQTVKATAPI